jgi:hypothetical protein
MSFWILPATTTMNQPIDKEAIFQICIRDYFIKENQALQNKLLEQQDLLESYAEVVSERNRTIANLSAIIADLRRELHLPIRRMVDQHGRTGYFSRGADGIFRELEVIEEEPLRSVRRRLNYDSDSTEEDIDEFTRMLFDFD